MPDRTLVASATNLLARGYLVVPTDRRSHASEPVNALFAVARAIHRVLAFKLPARAVAVIDAGGPRPAWPPLLQQQVAGLPALLAALGLRAVVTDDEPNLVAAYARAALAKRGIMTLKFRPAAPGSAKLVGNFKLSVCSDETCEIESPRVELAVPVT